LIKQLHWFDLLQGCHCWQFLFALLGAPCTSYVRYPHTPYAVSIPVYLRTMLLAFILLQSLNVTVFLTGDHGRQQRWLSNQRSTTFFASIKTIIFKLPPIPFASTHKAMRPKALCYQVLPFLPIYVSHQIQALFIHVSIRVTAACSRSFRLFPSASFPFNPAGCRMQGISLQSSSNIKNTIQAFLASITVLFILPQRRKSFHFLLNGVVEYEPNARDHYTKEPNKHLPCQARKTLAKPSPIPFQHCQQTSYKPSQNPSASPDIICKA
jgi:hypothetical protein